MDIHGGGLCWNQSVCNAWSSGKGTCCCVNGNLWDKCLFKHGVSTYSEMTDSDTSLQGPLASFIWNALKCDSKIGQSRSEHVRANSNNLLTSLRIFEDHLLGPGGSNLLPFTAELRSVDLSMIPGCPQKGRLQSITYNIYNLNHWNLGPPPIPAWTNPSTHRRVWILKSSSARSGVYTNASKFG